jgi:hypothetical protein
MNKRRAVTGMTQTDRNVSLITLGHREAWKLGVTACDARQDDRGRVRRLTGAKRHSRFVAISAILQAVDALGPWFDNAESVE